MSLASDEGDGHSPGAVFIVAAVIVVFVCLTCHSEEGSRKPLVSRQMLREKSQAKLALAFSGCKRKITLVSDPPGLSWTRSVPRCSLK